MKHSTLFIIFALFSISLIAKTKKSHPHIVLIMADDMGFSDLGCYGSEIPTPNIDELAETGIRFTQFKNTSRCCPSRASLLSGRFQHAVEMGWMTAVDEHRPGYRGQISDKIPTIAEILSANGYSTYMSGKWHLTVDGGWNIPDAKPNGSWPSDRGFEKYYGSLAGGGSYYTPKGLTKQNTPLTVFPDDFYYTSAITKNAVSFIQNHETSKPMFLYLAHYAPHRPLQAPKKMVDANREKYKVGYDELKRKRYEKQKTLGIINNDLKLPFYQKEYDGNRPSWESLDENTQSKWVTEMATFSAMIEVMDDGIGQVVNMLKQKGMYDNTIILFLSDNGATNEGGQISQLAADLSNTPYRSYKGYTYMGGISSPLIIHHPNYQQSNGDIRCGQAHITDILPTCLDFAEIAYPKKFKNEKIPSSDGHSIVTLLNNKQQKQHDYFFEHRSSCSAISGKWRLVKGWGDKEWELYNLENDPYEQNDISSEFPNKTELLKKKWNAWANKNNVLPLENKTWNNRIDYYKNLNPDQDGIN